MLPQRSASLGLHQLIGASRRSHVVSFAKCRKRSANRWHALLAENIFSAHVEPIGGFKQNKTIVRRQIHKCTICNAHIARECMHFACLLSKSVPRANLIDARVLLFRCGIGCCGNHSFAWHLIKDLRSFRERCLFLPKVDRCILLVAVRIKL